MPQINLLKQNTRTFDITDQFYSIVAKILVVAVLGLLGYYGWLFNRGRKLANEAQSLTTQISEVKTEMSKIPGQEELATRQKQLEAYTGLANNHLYWSHLFPELAKVTLRTSSYVSINALADGNLTLSTVLPDIAELDKFLQVFDRPEFNKYFSDVSMGSIGQSKDTGGSLATQVDIRLKFDTSLLKYAAAAAASSTTTFLK